MPYRLRIDLTYSSTANATTATTNINNVLTTAGRPETATRTNAQVTLVVDGIADQSTAISLRNSLTTAWGATTRSGGRASVTRYDS